MAATIDDVRRIALGLPETIEVVDGQRGGAAWRTRSGLFVWERGPGRTDLAKLAELGRSWPDGTVVGVRTDGLDGKQALLESFPDAFFTIPHFEGYPAVLVRLDTDRPRPAARGRDGCLAAQGVRNGSRRSGSRRIHPRRGLSATQPSARTAAFASAVPLSGFGCAATNASKSDLDSAA